MLQCGTDVGKIGISYDNIYSTNIEKQAIGHFIIGDQIQEKKENWKWKHLKYKDKTIFSPGEQWVCVGQALCSALHCNLLYIIVFI